MNVQNDEAAHNANVVKVDCPDVWLVVDEIFQLSGTVMSDSQDVICPELGAEGAFTVEGNQFVVNLVVDDVLYRINNIRMDGEFRCTGSNANSTHDTFVHRKLGIARRGKRQDLSRNPGEKSTGHLSNFRDGGFAFKKDGEPLLAYLYEEQN